MNFEFYKVAIIGPESSGKSTLARYLANRYGGILVPEYARTFVEQLMIERQTDDWTRVLTYDDLCSLAKHQIEELTSLNSAALNRPQAAKQDDSPLNNTNGALNALSNAWAILQTFTFITFTRLFFRSSSNLDPATANEVAWATAKNMVNQIGGAWNNAIIPDFLWEYRWVVAMFVAGMVIHWLPTNWKRRYRLAFSAMPLWLMVIAVCVAIVIIYQFVSAEMQPFIYFQF